MLIASIVPPSAFADKSLQRAQDYPHSAPAAYFWSARRALSATVPPPPQGSGTYSNASFSIEPIQLPMPPVKAFTLSALCSHSKRIDKAERIKRGRIRCVTGRTEARGP